MFPAKVILIIFLFLAGVAAMALPPSDGVAPFQAKKPLEVDNYKYIDANKILMFVTNHGNFGRDLSGYFGCDFGTFYPYYGTEFITQGIWDKSVLYAGGLWIGGKVNDEIRVTVSEYASEYVPGTIGGGNSNDPIYRVYRLHKDSLAGNPNADYLEWPVDQGAPLNSEGKPRLYGDQTLWAVYNDNDPAQHVVNSGETDPLGIEIQQTVWAADQAGAYPVYYDPVYPVQQYGTTETQALVTITTPYGVTGHDYLIIVDSVADYGRVWHLFDVTENEMKLSNRPMNTTDWWIGVQITVSDIVTPPEINYWSPNPPNISPFADPYYTGNQRWFTAAPNSTGDLLLGGISLAPDLWHGSNLGYEDLRKIEIRFRPMTGYTDLDGNGLYTKSEPYTVDNPDWTQKAFMYNAPWASGYEGFYDVPFTVYDVTEPLYRQLNVVVYDWDGNHQWDLHDDDYFPNPLLPNNGDTRYNRIYILNSEHDHSGTLFGDGTSGTLDFFNDGVYCTDAMYMLWLSERIYSGMLAEECVLTIDPHNEVPLTAPRDTFSFTATPPELNTGGPEAFSIYIMYKLFNKGQNTIEDCYLALWSDPDLGWAGDDLVGCDTLGDMLFCYNGTNFDNQYGNILPAVGFKILYGPLVPAEGETGYFDGAEIADHKNLDMTAFAKYIGGTDPNSAIESYNYMRGLDAEGNPYPNGTKFMVPGDPFNPPDDCDAFVADRRMMGSMGPFTFNPGDSQFVLVKMAVSQADYYYRSITEVKKILNEPFNMPTATPDEHASGLPRDYRLEQNYPNPFNPSTTIRYALPSRGDVTLEIFNILGRKIRTLEQKEQAAGNYAVVWDGRDNAGREVASGVYFYRLKADDFEATQKMLLIK